MWGRFGLNLSSQKRFNFLSLSLYLFAVFYIPKARTTAGYWFAISSWLISFTKTKAHFEQKELAPRFKIKVSFLSLSPSNPCHLAEVFQGDCSKVSLNSKNSKREGEVEEIKDQERSLKNRRRRGVRKCILNPCLIDWLRKWDLAIVWPDPSMV